MAIVAADVAWMMTATTLVLLMTPALAFFCGGLVRSKNAGPGLDVTSTARRPAPAARARSSSSAPRMAKVYRIRTGEEDQAAVTPVPEVP